MLKNVFPVYTLLNKIFSQLIISLMIFHIKFSCVYNNSLASASPVSLQIDDDLLFIATEKGMHFWNLKSNSLLVHHDYYYYNITDFQSIVDTIRISKLDNEYGGEIFCLIVNQMYHFDKNGNIITIINLKGYISESSYVNLTPYKKENNIYHFLISFINGRDNPQNCLTVLHFIFQDNKCDLVAQNYYKPFYLDYTGIIINSAKFTCQIVYSEKFGREVFTCCYHTVRNSLLVVQSFDLRNKLVEIEEYYSKIPIDNLNLITSTVSEDKKNMLICYSPSNSYGYCFTYNFDTNTITNNRPYIEKCLNQYTTFKLNYFSQTEEYVLICLVLDSKFSIIKFNKNFERINPDEITTVNFELEGKYGTTSLSLIYHKTSQKYAIVMDSKEEEDKPLVSNFYLITYNFTQHYASQLEKPTEFIEVFEDDNFIIDESNKYYVYTEERSIFANSVDDRRVIIDFMDENNLFVKTRDNKTINASLYSYKISYENNVGRLAKIVEGVEKTIESGEKISNLTHLIYYPLFSNSNVFTITYLIYLKNNTQASKSTNFIIYVCKENCTCDENSRFCKECLPNYVSYLYNSNCVSIDELKNPFFNSIEGIYYLCYKMCKTCSQASYDDYNMYCLTCYTERGDYQIGYNCYEKVCDNLFYRDKDTQMKTCLDVQTCPEDYPNLDSETKECKRNITTEESESISETEINSVDSSEKPKPEVTTTDKSTTDEETTDKSTTDEETTDKSTTDEETTDKSTTDEETTDKSTTDEETTDKSTTNEATNKDTKSSISVKSDISTSDFIPKNNTYQLVMNLIKEAIPEGKLDEINIAYSALSNIITSGNIISFEEDFIISGKNITYQITTSANQNKAEHNQNVSVIDLGDCEKIIKKNISYEDDPTPLIILKIDIKKEETRTTAVEYEVYNPYTKIKIDLSICSNVSIRIYAPVNLTDQENYLYNDLNGQGYNLYDVNNSFYLDPCTQYTSQNGTDVSLIDRKDYYYNEDIVLCEDICKYIEVNTTNEKVSCECQIKDSVNLENNQEFSPKKLLENFYKINTYANFEVLFCYKLVFSSKGLKKNICFYIILVLFVTFLTSMIINLFSAIKKIDDLIFKIFQDRFMFYFMQKIIKDRRKRRDAMSNININNDINKKEGEKPKLSWLQKLKTGKQSKEKENVPSSIVGESLLEFNNNNYKTNLISLNDKNNNKLIKSFGPKIIKRKDKKLSTKIRRKNIELENNINNIKYNETNVDNNGINNSNQKNLINIEKNEENKVDIYNKEALESGANVNNININIINNVMNKQNPPIKKNNIFLNESNEKPNDQKLNKKIKKKKKKKLLFNENSNSLGSNSVINLNKFDMIKKQPGQSMNPSNEQKEGENKDNNDTNKKEEQKKPANNKLKYIDEELNRMDYDNAIINDKRSYWQYYWSLLKLKHLIILTFVSNDDYNVFLLKFSLFILSLALFFSINTLFYKDETLHTIFSENGKYNFIYQIPQVLYSTLISLVMSFFLKQLSLSQKQIIAIKKELDLPKARKLSEATKKCISIKMYSFFSFGLILLIFFWYYITSFAAVYKNTQLHLIKDTLLSFGLSMIYPLFFNFVPGFFRFPALKSEKKNRKCLYRTGQLFAYF